MLSGWGSGKYSGDTFPHDMSDEQVSQLKKRYRHVREEFYTKTGMDVVTPDNVEDFVNRHKTLGIRWALQEQFSGSGRTSAEAVSRGISTLFPIDLRYGWDLRNPEHQRKIDQVRENLRPLVKMSSPDCRLWSCATNANDKSVLQAGRHEEVGMLEWLVQDNAAQAKGGRGYINENGLTSHIWTQSPLAQNADLPGNLRQRGDGCSHGLTTSLGEPVLKPYRLDANFPLPQTARRCPGHGEAEHQRLQGQDTNRTTVYSHKMCRSLVRDIITFLDDKHTAYVVGACPDWTFPVSLGIVWDRLVEPWYQHNRLQTQATEH